MLKKMSKSAKKLYTDVKMGYLRQNANNDSLEYSGYQNIYMAVFEAIAFAGIAAFNLYHVKGMLENRRII